MSDEPRPYCSEMGVHHPGMWLPGRCSRRGTVLRGGKWWCAQHDPEKVTTKRKAKEDARRTREREQEAIKVEGARLAERLGGGSPHYDTRFAYTRNVVIPFELAEKILKDLGSGRAAGER